MIVMQFGGFGDGDAGVVQRVVRIGSRDEPRGTATRGVGDLFLPIAG